MLNHLFYSSVNFTVSATAFLAYVFLLFNPASSGISEEIDDSLYSMTDTIDLNSFDEFDAIYDNVTSPLNCSPNFTDRIRQCR